MSSRCCVRSSVRLERGDLLLGDAFYATYFLLCRWRERGIDAVFEQHGPASAARTFAAVSGSGERDHLMVLDEADVKPDWMSQADYEQAPPSLTVRELRTGGKTW